MNRHPPGPRRQNDKAPTMYTLILILTMWTTTGTYEVVVFHNFISERRCTQGLEIAKQVQRARGFCIPN